MASRASSQTASPVPAPPASRASSVVSVSSRRTRDPREAPSARRNAVSLRTDQRPREQEAGEVGARQQQHERDYRHQQPRRGPDEDVDGREEQHVGEPQDHELPGRVPVLDAVAGELCCHCADGSLGLG